MLLVHSLLDIIVSCVVIAQNRNRLGDRESEGGKTRKGRRKREHCEKKKTTSAWQQKKHETQVTLLSSSLDQNKKI